MFQKAYDVVVCGGGVAGVSAALAAARAERFCLGLRVVLPGQSYAKVNANQKK